MTSLEKYPSIAHKMRNRNLKRYVLFFFSQIMLSERQTEASNIFRLLAFDITRRFEQRFPFGKDMGQDLTHTIVSFYTINDEAFTFSLRQEWTADPPLRRVITPRLSDP